MTFLPIAERELRVAARKRHTYFTRLAAAVAAMLVSGGFFLIGRLTRSGTSGLLMFQALTWFAFIAALLAGVFFTSDSLSQEKREGTLGLLFLTELRGYDVVAGKLLATALRAAYGMLAVFPVIALSLMLGGITGAQFWKVILAIANSMFVSLAAALFVSAVSRDSQRALFGTVLILVAACGLGPLLDSLLQTRKFFSVSSPIFLFSEGQAARPFWMALLVNHLIGWGFLMSSALLLPRLWQERKTESSGNNLARHWTYGGPTSRRKLREKLLSLNPVLWLTSRERWQVVFLWLLAILVVGALLVMIWFSPEPAFWFSWSGLSGIFILALYLGVASQAARFFVEGRRTGLIELCLVSPLRAHEIVEGQWRALVRMFTLPACIFLVAQGAGAFMAQRAMHAVFRANASVSTTVNGVTNTVQMSNGPQSTQSQPAWVTPVVATASSSLTVICNLAALAWFGMWTALQSKSSNIAALKGIFFVQIIPWFAISFASALLVPLFLMRRLFASAVSTPASFEWVPVLMSLFAMVLAIGKDAGFILWSRRRLYEQFRARVAEPVQQYQYVPVRTGPPVIAMNQPG